MAIATNHKLANQLSHTGICLSTQHAVASDYAPGQHIIYKWVKAVPSIHKLMLVSNADIVSMAYMTKLGCLQIAYLSKNKFMCNNQIKVVSNFYTTDSINECTECTLSPSQPTRC